MTIQFQVFKRVLTEHPEKTLRFVLLDSKPVPAHFHITDVGSVFRHFIDCGGQVREESYVQIQLWLGADREHRLTAETASKILHQSQEVLTKLPHLAHSEVMIEYQTDLMALYSIDEVEVGEFEIVFSLAATQTQCLAALRHEQEKQLGQATACCAKSSCCG
ncbi:DUF6428 family protein [Thiomicrorhabdus chilensis]|uniref:DUF6428 family protein n=1 Tax=Thiomicrorhabdus chilensis TaxID=63656 RepID=UPI000417FABF|nr:DUF6428 family protein [Thiomicrorhabdus chilensis]